MQAVLNMQAQITENLREQHINENNYHVSQTTVVHLRLQGL